MLYYIILYYLILSYLILSYIILYYIIVGARITGDLRAPLGGTGGLLGRDSYKDFHKGFYMEAYMASSLDEGPLFWGFGLGGPLEI